jgi:RecT family
MAAPQASPQQLEKIEERIDKTLTSAMGVSDQGISFRTASEVMEFAKMMAVSGSAVPPHLRGQPGACLGIIDDAIRFGFSPYALARKSYFVNDNLAYEAQVLSAIVCARAPFRERPEILFEGEGNERICIVVFRFLSGEDRDYRSPVFGKINPKNSPLWKNDPDQQHAYYSIRAAARRHCSDVLMGIYDYEELAASRARDVTPRDPRPNLINALDRLSGPSSMTKETEHDDDGVVREEETTTETETTAGETGGQEGGGATEANTGPAAGSNEGGDPRPEPPSSTKSKSTSTKKNEKPDGGEAASAEGRRTVKVPKTQAEYIEYARAWFKTDAPDRLRIRWSSKEEKDIRNKANVDPDAREPLFEELIAIERERLPAN